MMEEFRKEYGLIRRKFKDEDTPIQIPRRAPLIGEHNEEIYVKELGLSHDDLIALVEAGII